MAGTGYHNDQFFNLGAAGEPGSAQKVDGQSTFVPLRADNAIFSYPDNQIRTDDHTGRRNQTLKKGYIRSMLTSNSGVKVSLRKCQFQFNPTTLQQSVSSNSSMLNFLQQDPAQYAQPMPGNVNFSFTLFFDRSMEINNAKTAVVSNPNLDSTDLWRDNSPGQVGVLHDLSAFFGVVGQGLNKSQIEYMKNVLQDTITAEANASTQEDSATQGSKALGHVDNFLSINLGNSAFLLPVPVRVVFSSLYIVEGLVTNTTVAFTKFSSTLVPMQCSVTVTMEAKYIGFAKVKTFFTESLKARELAELQEKQEAAERKKATVEGFSKALGRVSLAWFLKPEPDLPTPVTVNEVLNTKLARVYLGMDLPLAKANGTAISDELDSGSGARIQLFANYTVYKSPSSLARFRGSLETLVAQYKPKPLVNLNMSPSSESAIIDSSASWKAAYSSSFGVVASTPFLTTNDYLGPIPINVATDWFIIKATVRIDVRTSNGDTITANGVLWKAVGPGTGWDEQVSINVVWPKVVIPDTLSAAVPASNAGTAPPKAGDSSLVGAPTISTKPAPKPRSGNF